MHPLADFRLKLNRANEHLETLKREIDAWFKKQPYGITGKYDPGPPEKYVLYFRFFEPPPPRWGLLIGDFVHNCRSALDYLAWQLVKANSQTPTHRTQFPIVLSPWEWPGPNGCARLRGASDRHIEMVERFQPYNRVDSEGFSYSRRMLDDPFTTLSYLSNEDKHRVLVATTAALSSIGWDFVGARDVAPITDYGTPYFGPLDDGAPLIDIPITATGPNPEVEVKLHERAHIAVSQRIDLKDGTWTVQRVDVVERFTELTLKLGHVFHVFVREFV